MGTGVWGRALAEIARSRGHEVQLWARRGPSSLAEVVTGVDILISALPLRAVRTVAQQVGSVGLAPGAIVVSATKGLEPDTILTPREIWQEVLPGQGVVVLSGPNLAEEVLAGKPCATVVAHSSLALAQHIQQALATDTFRVYVNPDIRGVELGGVLKNVIAISAGVSDGLGLGTNAKAALITRGLTEVVRVGCLLGGEAATFYGLSGLGDLQATCTSSLSRNYQVGFGLAHKEPLADILARLTGTAEGINTAHVLVQLAHQRRIEVPIALQVTLLLDGKTTPLACVTALMARGLKEEL